MTTVNLRSQVTDLTNKVFTCRIFLVWKILLIYLGLQKLIPLQNVPRNGYGKFKHSVLLNFQTDYTFYPSVALSCLKYKNLHAKDVSCSALNLKFIQNFAINIYIYIYKWNGHIWGKYYYYQFSSAVWLYKQEFTNVFASLWNILWDALLRMSVFTLLYEVEQNEWSCFWRNVLNV